MAHVIKTVLTYPLNGVTRDFTIPFEYLARKFIVVTLLGKDRRVLTLNTDYRFSTRNTISTTKAWGSGDGYTLIELRRVTSATERLVDFTDGSILRAYDLNVAQIQTMHVAEEARDLTADTIGVNNDGDLDARGRRIVNLAHAVDDTDAVPLGQLKTMNQSAWQARNEAQQFRNEAEQFRNQAEGFKNESATHASNTNVWRNDAERFRYESERFKDSAASSANSAANSASAAHTSEVNAANSATASANSAVLSNTHADRAKAEADKLGSWNALAGAVQEVNAPNVTWRGLGRFTNGVQIQRSEEHRHVFRQGLWASDNALRTDYVIEWEGTTKAPDVFLQMNSPWSGGATLELPQHSIFKTHVDVNGALQSTYENFSHTFRDQYGVNAPFYQFIRTQGTSDYFPIIKQNTYQTGRWAGSWSAGTLLTSGAAEFHIFMINEGGSGRNWVFREDGSFTSATTVSATAFGVQNGSFNAGGRVWGSAYNNGYLDDWIRANFVGFIYMGARVWHQKWGGYVDLIVPDGSVQVGLAAGNSGDVAGIFSRQLWMGFHNGQNRLVTVQN